MKDRPKIRLFNRRINGILFILISIIMLIPIYKVLVDSFDLSSAYGMRLWPKQFGLAGYAMSVLSKTRRCHRPLLISVGTTIGRYLSLVLHLIHTWCIRSYSVGYAGKNILCKLPVVYHDLQWWYDPDLLGYEKSLGLTNNLLGVVLLPAINIYNLVLMRNFFEGIPQSLFEAATLDGCTPMATFIKVVLPLSKAALASIGLMFAVAYWNDYTNYKLYITDSSLYNFQMKLRSIMMGSDLPQANGGATENTVKSAAIIIAILPFMILYPFLQKYFVKGVNVGAVKG